MRRNRHTEGPAAHGEDGIGAYKARTGKTAPESPSFPISSPRRPTPPPPSCSTTARCSGARASGAAGTAVGEVCFNTSMTGYQEILTDPSYAGQIITFTFPHIGNVGTNPEDIETVDAGRARLRAARRRSPSRRTGAPRQHLDAWLKPTNLVGIAGVDTRRLTRRIRDGGAPHAASSCHAPGRPLRPRRAARPRRAPGRGSRAWTSPRRSPAARPIAGTRRAGRSASGYGRQTRRSYHVVAVDYGAKRNILRCLAGAGCEVTVVPATATRRGHAAPQARRRLPVQRPGRSGGDRRLCRAGDPAT